MGKAELRSGLWALFVVAATVGSHWVRADLRPAWDVALLPLFALVAALFILPGVFVVGILSRKSILEGPFRLFGAFVVACVPGLLAFWIFYLNATAGRVFSWGFLGLCALGPLVPALRRALQFAWGDVEVRVPLVAGLLIGLFYISITYGAFPDYRAHQLADEHTTLVVDRFSYDGAQDYLVQYFTAQRLLDGQSIWDQVLDKFRTTNTDRPPLLAGISVIPLSVFSPTTRFYVFMMISTLAQLVWIPVLWGGLRIFGLSIGQSLLGLLLAAQTPMFFFYSVFTWPKLLAGGLLGGAVLLYFTPPFPKHRRLAIARMGFVSVAAALGCLSHPASAPILVPAAALALFWKRLPPLKTALAGVALFSALVFSWYGVKLAHEQKNPGLLRYLLTDHYDLDVYLNPMISTPRAAQLAYESQGLETALRLKAEHVGMLFYRPLHSVFRGIARSGALPDVVVAERNREVLNVVLGYGGLSIPLLFFLLVGWRNPALERLCWVAGFLPLLFLSVITFHGDSVDIVHFPMSCMILLAAVSIRYLAHWPRWLASAVLVATTVHFFYVWAIPWPMGALKPNLPLLLACPVLFFTLIRFYRLQEAR